MAATATLGKIDEYEAEKEDWQQYVERLDHFFTANGIADAGKKRAVFLSIVGASTYKLLRNLVAPAKPGDKTFAQRVEVLSTHFRPTPSEIVERCRFHGRYRKPGESIATFVSELRSLTEFCNFGATLETMIRDRLVCGVNDVGIQKRLLSEPGLTYAKAVELAQSLESAAQNVKELKVKPEGRDPVQPNPRQEVHKLASSSSRRSVLTCYRCGKAGHVVAKCRFSKDVICHQCGKTGHLRRACKSSERGGGMRKQKNRSP